MLSLSHKQQSVFDIFYPILFCRSLIYNNKFRVNTNNTYTWTPTDPNILHTHFQRTNNEKREREKEREVEERSKSILYIQENQMLSWNIFIYYFVSVGIASAIYIVRSSIHQSAKWFTNCVSSMLLEDGTANRDDNMRWTTNTYTVTHIQAIHLFHIMQC